MKTTMIVSALAIGLLAGCGERPDANGRHEEAEASGSAHNHGARAHAPPEKVGGMKLSGARCEAHAAPKEWCFICDAALRDKGRLWCSEHDRYEDRCWLCHPELEDKNRLWCKEHSLYEDECFLCHPELKQKPGAAGSAAKASASEAGALMCKEHDLEERECGVCHPELTGQLKPGESMKVRLPDTNSAAMAGVTTGKPEKGWAGDGIDVFAEILFDQNKLAQIAAPVGGIIQSVDVDLGDTVQEKQAVAKIWSATIAETVAKAVLTHQTLERERKLRAERVTSERDLQQAEAEHRAACQQARTLGFSEEQINAFGANPDEPVMLEVRAPFAGEIVERSAVRGSLVEPGKPLLAVADRSTMWAMLSVPEAALGKLRTGQTVEVRVDSLPGRKFAGKLTWVAARVDDRTRMASARVELNNPDGMLRANMFARARIATGASNDSLVVPTSAIHRVEGQPLAFVKVAQDLYEARVLRVGARSGGMTEVLEGLSPDDSIVVSQGFALKSHLLSSRLGAGCAHE